mmetsp:Transcript_28623/g.63906  ORF Transcript_28623/g.63906 Transcript_28623/m.63906 type:complete len:631 (-) Transcript_28623:77-1969(-)|eukprot:CAMPEP_0172597856 /NCGR_PEP_ID=MMETSP1068-20121228/17830_1 /TAXON_ID=35684 /ORGANISM="Pseudopedinella elastica, Strain CCMP716" /LENGTH=630 /DNA_ID=CAMNT_0013397487 /DNA_START=38 /DNA_END=1930 /DNA_ORIENTATION=+
MPTRIWRRLAVRLFLSLVVFSHNVSVVLGDGLKTRFNVLMIILDDFRPDLKSFGHKQPANTPSIDAFAKTARVFRRAYSQFPDCAPSRTSFLTGLRPDHTGISTHECTNPNPKIPCFFRDVLPAGTVTLPQYFKEAGYISLSYGKVFHQHSNDELSWTPKEQFDDEYKRLNHHVKGHEPWDYQQKMGPVKCKYNSSAEYPDEVYDAPDEKYIDHKTTSFALTSMHRLGRMTNPRQPWFLAVGHIRPHLPFVCPRRFRDEASDPFLEQGGEPPAMVGLGASSGLRNARHSGSIGFGELKDFLPDSLREFRQFNSKSRTARKLRSDIRRGYRACMAWTDFQVGRLLDGLKNSSQEDSTVVALFSDHGWKLGEFEAWGKHTTLHADIHVPLMIRHPFMNAPGSHFYTPVELLDIFPTLVSLAAPWGLASDRTDENRPSERPTKAVMQALVNLDGASLAAVVIGVKVQVVQETLLAERELCALTPLGFCRGLAVAQFSNTLGSARCMAYAVIDSNAIITRWTDHPRLLHHRRCTEVNSGEVHSLSKLAGPETAIPFSLEKNNNLVGSNHGNATPNKFMQRIIKWSHSCRRQPANAKRNESARVPGCPQRAGFPQSAKFNACDCAAVGSGLEQGQ